MTRRERPWPRIAAAVGLALFAWQWRFVWNTVLAPLPDWSYLRAAFGAAMVAVGVDWAAVSEGDKLNAVIGLIVGAIGLGLGAVGTTIATFQYRGWRSRSRRQIFLKVEISETGSTARDVEFDVIIVNLGQLAAHSYYWSLLIPDRFDSKLAFFPSSAAEHDADLSHRGAYPQFRGARYRGFRGEPAFQSSPVRIEKLVVSREGLGADPTIYWQTTSEHGTVPSDAPRHASLRIRDWMTLRGPSEASSPVDN